MHHLVKVFAGIRESVGTETLQIEILDGTTALDIKEQLANRYPDAAELIRMSRLAVDQKFVSDEHALAGQASPGDEIALIPPVSGG